MQSRLTSIFLAGVIYAFCAAPLFGQATFGVASSPGLAADIGVTELTGTITLIVSSGVTVPAAFTIRYSAAITNDTNSGIAVTGTGNLTAASASIDRSSGLIILNVPGGGTTGDTISLAGVRVALAGLSYKNVTANISSASSSGNAITAGQTTVTVISSIQQPFSVALSSTDLTSSILLEENYANAFTGSVGVYGQTVPSQLKINPFPSIPGGVTLTFPQKVIAPEDGAYFITSSGGDETVPRSDGSTTVKYTYTGPAAPSLLMESFNFEVTATVHPPTTGGNIAFQVTLLPIGIAIPDSEFPSTDIPRYAERAVPDVTDLITGSSQLAFPYQAESSGIYTGIAITNPLAYPVKVTLTAYDVNGTAISGSNVTNPVTITMPKNAQLAEIASDLFGQHFNASGPGTIMAIGRTPVLAGFYLQGGMAGQGLDGTTAAVAPVQSWVWPSVFRGGASPFTIFQISNPATSTATATLRLYDSKGNVIALSSPTIPAGGTMLRDLRDVFPGVNLNSFEGGYVTGDSDAGVVVSENFGNALDFNILQGQTRYSPTSFRIAHFASGGGYSTEINLVNADPLQNAVITITAFDNNGAMIAAAENPLKLTIAAKQQTIQTIDQLFPSFGSSPQMGYIGVDVVPIRIGPYVSSPQLVGSVRFTAADGSGSAALPLFLAPAQDFVYSHVAQDFGYFTGIALLNPTSVAASLSLQVFRQDGSSVGSFTTTLRPGQKIANLLFELVPSSSGQVGGYVRIHSDQPVLSFSLFGTLDLKLLSAIPPQSVAQ